MSAELTIAMGAISDPIEKQIKDAGLNVPIDCPKFQQAADAITRLVMSGYLTPSAANTARKKLVKDVGASVSKANGE